MPIAFVDGNTHAIRYANPAFCLLVGEGGQTLIGDTFAHALPGSSECVSLLDRVNRTGRAETYTGQACVPSHPLYFSYVLWPVFTKDRHPVGIMVQVTETTAFHNQAIEINQALMLGSVRQHELTESAETLNAQLQAEIVQRKKVEEEIEASEQRYRGLIEAIPQIVWTATPEGTLDFANANWSGYLGIDLDTFNKGGWATLLHPNDTDRTTQAWANGLQSGLAFEIEHRLRNNLTGNFRWYLSRAVPLETEDGQIFKWFGTSTDMEDQKNAELAMFNKQKLESLGILAGGIAHDFNNLLTGIMGGASLAADALPPSHFLQSILSDMVRSSERAAHLTRQMLAYAGKGSFFIEQVDINDLVRTTGDLIRASIPNHVQVSFDLRHDLPPVTADSGQIEQVAMNLMLNAAEAIESKSGSVTVKTDFVKLTEVEIEQIQLTTGSLVPGAYVVLQVQDNGSGISEAILARIFDPFYTTKFTGRGLGLSAVQGILRMQKGALEVRSTVGNGSIFRVYLPPATGKKLNPKIPVQPAMKGHSGTILVVDDEETVRRVSQLALENGGFSVRIAAGGEEALRILQSKTEGPFSLILLDLSMPGMGGKEMLRQLRALGIDIPVLIYSGYSEEAVLKEFSGQVIAGFIQKPFTPRQLADYVSGALNAERLHR